MNINIINRSDINNMFAELSCLYQNFQKPSTTEELKLKIETWYGHLKGFSKTIVKDAFKDAIGISLQFPPTLPQIVDLCWQHSGLPQLREALQLAIKKEFNHPVVLELHNKIGSWALRNESERTLIQCATEVYPEIISSYKSNPEVLKAKLMEYENEQVKLLEEPSVRVKTSDLIKEAENRTDKKTYETNKVHPKWEQDKVNQYSRYYDVNAANERKEYLMNLTEREATTLNPVDYYDRTRYLSEKLAIETVQKLNKNASNDRSNIVQLKKNERKVSCDGPRMYKNWMNDT